MTAVSEPAKARSRGNIRRMRDSVQVRVSAGEDPSTGERIILTDSVPTEIPDADELKVARTARPLVRQPPAAGPTYAGPTPRRALVALGQHLAREQKREERLTERRVEQRDVLVDLIDAVEHWAPQAEVASLFLWVRPAPTTSSSTQTRTLERPCASRHPLLHRGAEDRCDDPR